MTSEAAGDASRMPRTRLWRVLRIAPGERRPLALSFTLFFLLLGGYYVLKPLREEMGIVGGIDHLQWLFSATFLVMLAAVPLYSGLVARLPRRVFVPLVYVVFAASMVAFRAGLAVPDHELRVWAARAFFVWTSVYALFVVSVFWSFMNDVFRPEQSERLFGVIAAGGSLGALAGSAATASLVGRLGTATLLWLPCFGLLAATVCASKLDAWARRSRPATSSDRETTAGEVIGGSLLAGFAHVARSPYLLGICAFLLCRTFCATIAYFQQAELVRAAFPEDAAARTRLFASMNFAVQAISLALQALVTGRLVTRLGLAATLALLPLVYALGLASLSASWTLAILVAFGVARQATNYGIATPSTQMLWSVVPREDKYKAKSFVDTAVFRGGDAASSWAVDALRSLLSLRAAAVVALPVCALWIAVAAWLGRRNREVETVREGPGASAVGPT